jgi:hypothetical protein
MKCSHSRVCGLQNAVLHVMSKYTHMINVYEPSGEKISTALANECSYFNPQPLDFKGGAS